MIATTVRSPNTDKKLTKGGAIVLRPPPDDSHKDRLNCPEWRKDSALFSLTCMLGNRATYGVDIDI
jgi:hypothetical protein